MYHHGTRCYMWGLRGTGVICELSVPSTQFYSEPKTALKIERVKNVLF